MKIQTLPKEIASILTSTTPSTIAEPYPKEESQSPTEDAPTILMLKLNSKSKSMENTSTTAANAQLISPAMDLESKE